MLQNILVLGFVWLSATALANFFGITHPSYVGYYIGDGSNLLEVTKMGPYLEASQDIAVLQARMLCNRRCNHREDCLSNYVYLRFGQMYCVLKNLNLCQDQSAGVYGEEDEGINYDKIKDTGVPQSCQIDCLQLNNQSCAICHRDGCRSSDCTVCDHDCLECYNNTHPNIPLSSEVKCSLWAGVKNLYQISVTCAAEKFLLFRRSSTSYGLTQNTSTVPNVDNFGFLVYSFFAARTAGNLYIELQDSNLTTFSATYSGFQIGPGNTLSLRSFINGTAGDGMHAPLTNLNLVTNSSLYHPSCGPFWNISGSLNLTEPTPYGVGPCPGLGTAFWGVPSMSDAGLFQSGITWSTLTNHTIIKISLYMF